MRIFHRLESMIALTLIVLWFLGAISSYTMGGAIHIFLVVAIGMMLPRVIYGRKITH